MAKPRQIFSWILQMIGIIFGVVFIYIVFFDGYPNHRSDIFYAFIAYFSFACGREIYIPEVRLLQPCPKCGRDIKLTNTECPYCHSDLHVTGRFPGIDDDK